MKINTPTFEQFPLDDNDDLIDQLLEHNPRFQEMLQRRLRGKTVPAKEMLKKLAKA